MVAPGILTLSLTLYVAAVWWGVYRGSDTFLTGLLAGCASILMGVWAGFTVAAKPKLMEPVRPPRRGQP